MSILLYVWVLVFKTKIRDFFGLGLEQKQVDLWSHSNQVCMENLRKDWLSSKGDIDRRRKRKEEHRVQGVSCLVTLLFRHSFMSHSYLHEIFPIGRQFVTAQRTFREHQATATHCIDIYFINTIRKMESNFIKWATCSSCRTQYRTNCVRIWDALWWRNS